MLSTPFTLILTTLVALCLLCAPAVASPASPHLVGRGSNSAVVVNLRVEGLSKTIFEGTISTKGHNITTKKGGNHHCDGTNNNAHKKPGPTLTSALADGSKIGKFSFDGPYSVSLDDFQITKIGPNSQDKHDSWSVLNNFKFAKKGGCQTEIASGDEVLWAYDALEAAHILKLTGPAKAKKNVDFAVTVTDGLTGKPVQGAKVEGVTTDKNGHATILLKEKGTLSFKATKNGSIRSNALSVKVS